MNNKIIFPGEERKLGVQLLSIEDAQAYLKDSIEGLNRTSFRSSMTRNASRVHMMKNLLKEIWKYERDVNDELAQFNMKSAWLYQSPEDIHAGHVQNPNKTRRLFAGKMRKEYSGKILDYKDVSKGKLNPTVAVWKDTLEIYTSPASVEPVGLGDIFSKMPYGWTEDTRFKVDDDAINELYDLLASGKLKIAPMGPERHSLIRKDFVDKTREGKMLNEKHEDSEHGDILKTAYRGATINVIRKAFEKNPM